jgi:hypothetical protein
MSGLILTAKVAYDLAKKGMSIELQEKLMQLREEALELQGENLKLKTENLKLKKKEELQEKVKFKRKVYFQDGDEVPFCPYCYEKSKLLIHLSGPHKLDNVRQHYRCSECETEYVARGEEDFTIYSQRRI